MQRCQYSPVYYCLRSTGLQFAERRKDAAVVPIETVWRMLYQCIDRRYAELRALSRLEKETITDWMY